MCSRVSDLMKKSRELLPGVRLDYLTLTPYSSRFIQADGAVKIGRRNLRVGTLLNRSRWIAELRTFLLEVPSAHQAWKREISATNHSRPSTRGCRT